MRDNENMRTIIFMGRSGSGKTSLTQAILTGKVEYNKTQYISYYNGIIDTPGEYAENKILGRALALYSYEADVVGLLMSATEQYSLFPPNITCMTNREVIGIVTQTDRAEANPERARRWLELSGCEKIFKTSSKTGEGINDLIAYLTK